MKGSITGNTPSEIAMLKELQAKRGLAQDGSIGPATITDIAVAEGVTNAWPVSTTLYGCPTIVAKDISPFSPGGKAGCASYSNSMLGSFTYPRATTPISILIQNGKVVCSHSCHRWVNAGNGVILEYPETVIYRLNSGSFGAKRVKDASELPANIKWAVGGMGLCGMFAPITEGFTQIKYGGKTVADYSDVLRLTNHNVLGVKNGMVYLVYAPNMTGQTINALCQNSFKFEYAVLLDGGGLAAINGDSNTHKKNTQTRQGYLIQAVK